MIIAKCLTASWLNFTAVNDRVNSQDISDENVSFFLLSFSIFVHIALETASSRGRPTVFSMLMSWKWIFDSIGNKKSVWETNKNKRRMNQKVSDLLCSAQKSLYNLHHAVRNNKLFEYRKSSNYCGQTLTDSSRKRSELLTPSFNCSRSVNGCSWSPNSLDTADIRSKVREPHRFAVRFDFSTPL